MKSGVENVVTLAGRGEAKKVVGETFGPLAITPAWDGRGFRITHVPTGLMLPKFYRKTQTAKRDLLIILPLIDWSFTDPETVDAETRARVFRAIGLEVAK